jgi:hypothetical protein
MQLTTSARHEHVNQQEIVKPPSARAFSRCASSAPEFSFEHPGYLLRCCI